MSDVTTPAAVKTTARRVKAKVTKAASATQAAAVDAESSMKSAAAQILNKVESGAAAAKEWAVAQPDAIRGQVAERPLIAVGVSAGTAFAAGLVLGILLTRR